MKLGNAVQGPEIVAVQATNHSCGKGTNCIPQKFDSSRFCPAMQVARARQAGQRVIGEPVASGLALDESAMWDTNFTKAAAAVMSPPIRSKEHRTALKKALAGGLLQLVATDHAVFNSTQKAVGREDFRVIPNGVNGLEERMHVVWQELVVSGE